jgi:hypothetical protein
MLEALMNGEFNQTISRLLQLGAIETEYPNVTPEFLTAKEQQFFTNVIRYRITPFGRTVIEYETEKMGTNNPKIQKALEPEIQKMLEKLQAIEAPKR